MRTATATNGIKKSLTKAYKSRKKLAASARAKANSVIKPIKRANKKVVTYVGNHRSESAGFAALLAVCVAGALYMKYVK